jgi:HAD superfamily hydrolase (TIGR01662 family)
MTPPALVIFDLDDTLFDTTGQLDSTASGLDRITLFPAVRGLLTHLRSQGIRATIVTTGDEALQQRKVEILGLRALVDAVHICALPEGKAQLFERCLQEFGVEPGRTWIVGDRIDREIAAGNRMGCVTIRVMQGRHSSRVPQEPAEHATVTIPGIAGVMGMVGADR